AGVCRRSRRGHLCGVDTPAGVTGTLCRMDNTEHVDQLTRLGLTKYEAKAYLALIRRGSSTAAEVARIAGVPRQRIYDVLASLVERGLASTRPGRVVNYVASPPDTAIERLVSDHKQAVDE